MTANLSTGVLCWPSSYFLSKRTNTIMLLLLGFRLTIWDVNERRMETSKIYFMLQLELAKADCEYCIEGLVLFHLTLSMKLRAWSSRSCYCYAPCICLNKECRFAIMECNVMLIVLFGALKIWYVWCQSNNRWKTRFTCSRPIVMPSSLFSILRSVSFVNPYLPL
jgi:hypothetical protein